MAIKFGPISVPSNKPENFSVPVLPEGEYPAVIKKITERTVRGSRLSGRVLDIDLVVTKGRYAGTKLQDFCPLFADQPEYREWAQDTLRRIAWACGHGDKEISDSSSIEGVPLVVRVVQKEERYADKQTGEPKTVIKNKIVDYLDYKSWMKARQSAKPQQ